MRTTGKRGGWSVYLYQKNQTFSLVLKTKQKKSLSLSLSDKGEVIHHRRHNLIDSVEEEESCPFL